MTDNADSRDIAASQRQRPRRRRTTVMAVAAVAVIVGVSVVAVRPNQGEPQPGITDRTSLPSAPARTRIGPAVEVKASTGDVGLSRNVGRPVAAAEQTFALRLLRSVSRSVPTTNVSVSPASLAIALSMLQNGAAGSTRTQIQQTLGTRGLTNGAQNEGWAELMSPWIGSPSASLQTANSVWLQQNFPLQPPFLSALGRFYDAGVWRVDFAHDNAAAVAALNTWTSGRTHGRITKLFDDLGPATKLVLANAVYFRAMWATPFVAADTSRGSFIRTSGAAVRVPFLSASAYATRAAETSDYDAVSLPYRGARFAALAIMPRSGSPTNFLATLTRQRLQDIVGSLRSQVLDLSLPKFTTRSSLQLNHTLAALGMPQAFTDQANFSAMTPRAVQVGKVVQRVYLSVAEKGTEAAAATGVTIEPSAGRLADATVRFNRPFLFLVRDVNTGAIVFATQLNDPSVG